MPAVDKAKLIRVSRVADKSIAIQKTPKSKSLKKKMSHKEKADELLAMLTSIQQTQCTKDDMKTFTESVNSKLIGIEEKVSSQDVKIEAMNNRLAKCENQAASAQFQLELEKQRSLKNNVSIFGVGRNDGENLPQIVSSIFDKIGCAVTDGQVVNCYRLNGNGNNIIVVKLSDYEVKQNILKVKAQKPVKLGDVITCEANEAGSVIYINNHVTPFFGKLLKEGRIAVKKGEIHSCWINSFGCQLKLTENGKQHCYRSVDELSSLISKKPSASNKRALEDRSPSTNASKR